MRGRGIVWFQYKMMVFSVEGVWQYHILTVDRLFFCRSKQIGSLVLEAVVSPEDYLVRTLLEWKYDFFRTELSAVRIQVFGNQFSIDIDFHAVSCPDFSQNML